jgi:hypothetical protein
MFEDIYSKLSKDLFKIKKKLNPKSLLLLFFFFLKHYPSNFLGGFLFGISESSFRNYFNMILTIFLNKFRNKINFPNFRKKKNILGFKVGIIIDGVEQKIHSSYSNENSKNIVFSGKKQYPTFSKLVGISPITYKVIYCTNSYPGSYSGFLFYFILFYFLFFLI